MAVLILMILRLIIVMAVLIIMNFRLIIVFMLIIMNIKLINQKRMENMENCIQKLVKLTIRLNRY